MALEKTIDYKGLTVENAYFKIHTAEVRGKWVDGVKLYNVTLLIYVSPVKDGQTLRTFQFGLSGLAEDDLTFENYYTLLKADCEELDGSVDVV